MKAAVSRKARASTANRSLQRCIARALWIAVAAGAASSCGFITAGAASAAGSDSSASNAPAAITGFAVESAKTEPAHIRFTLADAESDQVEVELLYDAPDPDGSEPLEAVQGARLEHVQPLGGGPTLRNPMVLKASPQGEQHTFDWLFTQEKSVLDAGEWTPDVLVYARITGGVQALTPGANAARLGLGNDPPVIVDADGDGFADAELPTDEVVGLVLVSFLVSDSSSDPVGVAVEYALADGLDVDAGELPDASAFLPASEAGAGVGSIAATIGGTSVDFLWNPLADLGRTEHDVVLRITPDDRTLDDLGNPLGLGETVLTRAFRIDNNAAPIVQIDSGSLVANPDERRGIPVPYRVIDAESDLVDVVFQWRRPDEAFPELPTDNAALDAILADTLLRREHHVCTAYARYARGRAVPVDATSLRLPELAQGESWCVAAGIEGATLELLRPSAIPEPITPTWSANPLVGPVAALPLADGITALVLDTPSSTGRLREIELATGAVVREIATLGPGAPTALAFERGENAVLVASDFAGSWRLDRIELASTALTELFVSGASPPVRGLASLGTNAVLLTAGSSLLHLDYRDPLAPRLGVIRGDLATPWGIVVDPLATDQVYLAERDAQTSSGTGRILALELDSHGTLPVAVAMQSMHDIERPEALALARSGTRLLAVASESGGGRELVGIDLGAQGGNVPFAIGPPIAGEVASLTCGPEGLSILSIPSRNELQIGGGVEQRRRAEAYDPVWQRVSVAAAFDPLPRPGQTWRLLPPERMRATPAGVDRVFVWDTVADLGHGSLLLRAFARDSEAGITALGGAAPKRVRAALDVQPLELGGSAITDACRSVAAADLDGDGDQDLVSANPARSNLTVFFQSTPGSFDPAPLELGGAALTDFPAYVVAADLDGDGDLDLVSANSASNTLTVFFQSAPGVFDPAPLVLGGPTLTNNPQSVAAADLDGDGDLDLVAANTGSDTLTVFFQSTPGSFDPAPLELGGPTLTNNPQSVAAADLDGDGDLDLVSANSISNTLTVFFQSAPGSFGSAPLVLGVPAAFLPGSRPVCVAAADLDGDGDQDLVSANALSNNLTAFFQSAPGSFDPAPLELGGPALTKNPGFVAAADVDGDGDQDLVSANTGSDTLTVFLQSAPGRFDPTPELGGFPITDGAISVAAGDLDGDGDMDLVSANFASDILTVFFQSSPGSFGPGPLELVGSLTTSGAPTLGASSVEAADLDGDGDQDLVSAGSTLTVFFQSAPGSFDRSPLLLGGPSVTANPRSVAAADLDGDGDQDLVAATDGDNLTVFFQREPGSFDPTPFELGGSSTTNDPLSVVAADLDGDGDLDLVSANATSNTLTVFFQGAPGSFDPAPLELGGSTITSSPRSVAAADMDGDGDLDLVSANFFSGNLTVFFQSTPGSFDPTPLELGSLAVNDPVSVVAADLDGDGELDLVSANTISHTLTVFFQSTLWIFDPPLELGGLPTTESPRSVEAADLDGDGDLDLVSANTGSDTLTLFFQRAPGSFDSAPLALAVPGGIFGSAPSSVAAADVDGDGDIDLVSANLTSKSLTIFFGGHP